MMTWAGGLVAGAGARPGPARSEPIQVNPTKSDQIAPHPTKSDHTASGRDQPVQPLSVPKETLGPRAALRSGPLSCGLTHWRKLFPPCP